MKTLAIAAAGTGGHIIPAQTIAEKMKAQGWNILWFGGIQGLEHQLIPSQHPLKTLPMRGIRRHWSRYFRLPDQLLRSTLLAGYHLQRHRVSCVLVMGGYVTVPVGLAAKMTRIPILLHEQNALAGQSNQIISPWAAQRFTAFEDVLPDATCIGNPIRSDILKIGQTPYQPSTPLKLLILGGSQGAQALNQWGQITAKTPLAKRIEVLHMTGPEQHATIQNEYRRLKLNWKAVPYIQSIHEAYAFADLVIARSGAMTVSECIAAKRPAVWVPYPMAVDDHQTHNAQKVDQASWIVQQPKMDNIASIIEVCLQKPDILKSKHSAIKAPMDATEQLCQAIDTVG